MASSTLKLILNCLNGYFCFYGLALMATSLWFFSQVFEFTRLRNANHYLLDYSVYGPQAIPWLFFVVGLVIFAVSCVGFSGVRQKKKKLLVGYIIGISIAIFILLAIAAISLIFASNGHTEAFVKDTIWDVYFQAKIDNDVLDAFGSIEKKLQCCGAESPRDYKLWKNIFPTSCCDVYFHSWSFDQAVYDCDFSNTQANERHGCIQVAAKYAAIVMQVLSATSIFTAIFAVIALVVAIRYAKRLKQRISRAETPDAADAESKKILYHNQ